MKLRAVLRLTRVALHLIGGLATVGLCFPFCDGNSRRALKQRWSRRLLARLGVELRCDGPLPESGLIVANHISFLDIFAINAVLPASFVSKADVGRWPLIGWLAKHNDTIFLERGSRAAAQRARLSLIAHLRTGKPVALFPEGTTTTGESLLPFHSALLQAAIDAGSPVIPVALRYLDAAGHRCTAPAYVDDMNLLECLWTIASSPRIIAAIDLLEGLSPEGVDRRHLSAHAHRAIAHRLSATLPQPEYRIPPETAGDPGDALPSAAHPIRNPSPAQEDSLPI